MPPDGFLDVAGQRLECRSLPGRRDRPAILLLHEGLGCLSLWRDFPERLALATGAPVFAWSRAGYGASSACALPRPLTYMHEEALHVLPALIEAAGIGRHVLMGHSDGASIAAIHAGSGGRDGLAGVVLMAPHVLVEDVSIASIEAARTAWLCGDLRARLQRHHGANVDCAFLGWNGAWLDPGFRDWDLRPCLPGIEVPCLVIQGEDDEYGTMAQVAAIEALSGGPVEAVRLAACGHAPQKDQTDAVLAAVSTFPGPPRSMTSLTRRSFAAGLSTCLIAPLMPARAASGYRAYAEALLASPPRGAVLRPDLEAYLDLIAAEARFRAGRSPLTPDDLLRDAARAQALDMIKGDYVGHQSPSGYQFRHRVAAFTDTDARGDYGENAARDRQPGDVDKDKALRLFRQWLDSAGHKRNLMKPYYAFVATGAAQVGHHLYAVQMFWER